MSNRVLLGKKGSKYGMWVSKPGVNVLTAGEDQMMMSTDGTSFQIVASGVVAFPGIGNDAIVTIPNMGFTPLVLLSCPSNFVAYFMASSTSLRIRAGGVRPSISWPSGSTPISYAVTNQPVHH